MSDSNTQMMLLLLLVGGVAAMTMGSKGENNYTIDMPKINLGSIPEFDADQNMEDIEYRPDKTIEDVVQIEAKKENDLKKFEFGDVDRSVGVMVKWMLYEASTMWDMHNYLRWYMQKNDFRGLDDLRAAGTFESGILQLFNNLIAMCQKRQSEFRQIWVRLNEYGNFAWMAANQWLLNTPADIINNLRQFDTSELAYKAAMEIVDGKSMADINEKLLYLYREIKKQPAPALGTQVSQKLQEIIDNQTVMMQVDQENQGKFALLTNNQYSNVKRTTRQARAPDADPYSGAPGSYEQTAQYVGKDGVVRSMNQTYDAETGMTDFTMAYGQPGPAAYQTQSSVGDFADDSHRMAPGESVARPSIQPIKDFNKGEMTGVYGKAYEAVDPRMRPIDSETKSDLFGVKKGGGLFTDTRADFADQIETYQNAPSRMVGPPRESDDEDDSGPQLPAHIDDGYVKATANKVKPSVDLDAYTKEVSGHKRSSDLSWSETDKKRLRESKNNPQPTEQDLADADADPYDTTNIDQYDIVKDEAPRDELQQVGQVESWVGKSQLRSVQENEPEAKTEMDGDDMFAAVPAAATDLGIGMKRTELSVPKSALMTDPYAAVQTNPTKNVNLIDKSASTGATYRSRSFSMEQANLSVQALISPKKKTKDEIDYSEARDSMADAGWIFF